MHKGGTMGMFVCKCTHTHTLQANMLVQTGVILTVMVLHKSETRFSMGSIDVDGFSMNHEMSFHMKSCVSRMHLQFEIITAIIAYINT